MSFYENINPEYDPRDCQQNFRITHGIKAAVYDPRSETLLRGRYRGGTLTPAQNCFLYVLLKNPARSHPITEIVRCLWPDASEGAQYYYLRIMSYANTIGDKLEHIFDTRDRFVILDNKKDRVSLSPGLEIRGPSSQFSSVSSSVVYRIPQLLPYSVNVEAKISSFVSREDFIDQELDRLTNKFKQKIRALFGPS